MAQVLYASCPQLGAQIYVSTTTEPSPPTLLDKMKKFFVCESIERKKKNKQLPENAFRLRKFLGAEATLDALIESKHTVLLEGNPADTTLPARFTNSWDETLCARLKWLEAGPTTLQYLDKFKVLKVQKHAIPLFKRDFEGVFQHRGQNVIQALTDNITSCREAILQLSEEEAKNESTRQYELKARITELITLCTDPDIATGITILSSVFLVTLVGTGVMWFTDIYVEEIINQMTIREGSEVFEAWRKPPMRPMICIHIFNYTNMPEYTAKIDEKINLQEVGPYCYRETLEKKNVTFNPDGTVTYGDIRKHEYEPTLSKGSPNDTLVVPNLALMATLGMTKNLSFGAKLLISAFLKYAMHYSASTVTVTANDFILGYDDRLVKLGVYLAKWMQQDVPFNKFGLLTSRSAITDDTTTVRTGTNDVDRIGIVTEINGQTKLEAWGSEECNRIDGSDGAFFPRRTINESATLYLFHKDMCRKMPFIFDKEVDFQEDVMAMRFIPAPDMFNTKGTCFCVNNSNCAPDGVFDTSPCHVGVPIFMSFPHFLRGDPVLREPFEGLHPDPEKHDFYLDIQRMLGFTLGTVSRIQLNIQIQKSKGYDRFLKEFPNNLILPIAWLQVSAGEMPESLFRVIYHATFTVKRMQIALRWGCLLITIITFYYLIRYIRRKPVNPNADTAKENKVASQEMLASGPSVEADWCTKL